MIKISEVKKHNGETVEIAGFVKQVRDLKKMQFLVVRDVTESVQISVEKNENRKAVNDVISSLTLESSVRIKGRVNVDDFVKLNGVEIIPDEIEIANLANNTLPIDLTDFKSSPTATFVWTGVFLTFAAANTNSYSASRPQRKWQCANFG